MVVGGADRGVISYFCGHVYHKICLTGRFNAGCVACRVRARRATRAGSSATSSPVASPIMSPRHQKI
ncbi:RING-type domain-containing protein [Caenorhabditis elegans]|nr:RING-type domain-containing protein [Caenorhabditis elegans]CAQ76499.1 RING-type domain-containing protein [Caenorhabditis elegans]|eukprot:NP_001129796.1 Uncharacterized protein CELE_W09G3.6 [Caenorhabditis elegans]